MIEKNNDKAMIGNVAVKDNFVFATMDNEIYIINVSDKSNPIIHRVINNLSTELFYEIYNKK